MGLTENKILKVILGIIKGIIVLILACVAFIIIIQRISNNSISVGGMRIFNVVSESMSPKYEKGDILVVQSKEADNLKVGDDLVYLGTTGELSGRIVTHQVVEIEQTKDGKVFHTKGIANMIEDPIVKADQIYGKVIYRMKLLSIFNKLMYNIYFFYFVMVVPIGIIVFLEIRDRKENFI